MTIRLSWACSVAPGCAACAAETDMIMPQVPSSARRRRRRVTGLATGGELGLNAAPILRQLDRDLDLAGLPGPHEPEADRLLDLRPRQGAAEDLLAGGVVLDDAQPPVRQVAVRVGGVAEGDDRHRLAGGVVAERGAGDFEVRLGALRRN